MPASLRHPCSYPGCPRSSTHGGRCAQHAMQRRRAFDQARGTSAERGYDAAWRAIRRECLAASPLCARCGAAAVDVHHEPRYPSIGRDHRMYALISLCHRCHSAITSRQVR